jgi:hypothetical protein
MMPIKAWTDYPIVELGDVEGQLAPIRECQVTEWDRDKYVTVIVGGVTTSFKRGYVYGEPGRCQEVPQLTRRVLWGLPLPADS